MTNLNYTVDCGVQTGNLYGSGGHSGKKNSTSVFVRDTIIRTCELLVCNVISYSNHLCHHISLFYELSAQHFVS